MRTNREKIATASTWACFACEAFAIDPVFVTNEKTGDMIAMHRECITHVLSVMKPPAARATKRAILHQSRKGK